MFWGVEKGGTIALAFSSLQTFLCKHGDRLLADCRPAGEGNVLHRIMR